MKNQTLLFILILALNSININAQEVKLMSVANKSGTNHPDLPQWKDAGVSLTGRQDTYISIISEPAKDKVKRVVFIAAGQQSDNPFGDDHFFSRRFADGYTNVLTGQPDNYKQGIRKTNNLEGTRTLNSKSLASRLINSGKFPKESTLFVLGFDTRFGYFRDEPKKKRRENAFFSFLTSKFDASKVEVIVLAGQSRSGALMFRLGSRLRSNSAYDKIPLIVQGYDPVATNPVLVKRRIVSQKVLAALSVRTPATAIEEYLPINSENDKLINPHDHDDYCWKVDMNVTFPTNKRENLKVLNLHGGAMVSKDIHESIRAFAWTGVDTKNPTWYKEWWLNLEHEEMGGNFSDAYLQKTVEVGYQHIIYGMDEIILEKVYSYHNKPMVGNFNADYVKLEKAKGLKKNAVKKEAVLTNTKNVAVTKKSVSKSLTKDVKTVANNSAVMTELLRKDYSDIIYYGKCGDGNDCWRAHINDKNGKFTTTSYGGNMWFEGEKPINTPVAGDFNKDGYTDIAYYGKVGDGDDCWRVHLNDKNGKFTTTSYGGNMWFEGDKPINTPVAGDFNNDGYTDIAYYGKVGGGDNCWRVHINDKNGKFTATSYGGNMWFEGDKPINTPVAGDFNNDGYTDIAYYGKVGNGDDCWRVHLNNKNGKFVATSYGGNMWFEGDKPINTPVVGDFNNDGYTDIAYYGKVGNGDDCWRVHLNNKNGKFVATSYGGNMWFEGDEPINAPIAGDFNSDGYTDIAYYGKVGAGEDCWRVHLNDKNGKFVATSYGGNIWFKD